MTAPTVASPAVSQTLPDPPTPPAPRPRLNFAYGLPFLRCPPNPAFLSGDAIQRLAQTAEEAGFSAAFFTEHPIPSQKWRQSGGHDALDPFVGLSYCAAATSRIRLLTNLVVLPYRNPLLLAKTVASLDVLSGGRLTLGVGTGYLKGEYKALGVDFEERNELFEESVEAMRLAFAGEPFSYEGRHFSVRESASLPTPTQRPHPPFWLGGNSKLTRRRVAKWGSGWMPMPNPRALGDRRRSAHLETEEDLIQLLAYLREQMELEGRQDKLDVAYMTFEGGMPGTADFNLGQHLEALSRLAELGVTWIIANGVGDDMREALEQIQLYKEEIITQV